MSERVHRRGAVCGAAAAALLVALAPAAPAAGQVPEIRLARQFSMGYLQFNVLEHQELIEKHARALGIPQIKVSWIKFNGPAAINEALLSGTIDVGAGGVPGLLVLWSRTKGTANEVRGISALSSQPFLLNTRNQAIKSLADITEASRIALPAVKVSVQAIVLEMAAAKMFGPSNFAKFDALTVSMSPPDSTIALLSGGGEIDMVFGVPPFQEQQLQKPGIRTVLTSYEVLDGSHTFTAAWTSARFRERNPLLYKALIDALQEATEIVNKDKRAAAALWIADSDSKLSLDFVERIVAGPQVHYTLVPENTMKFATFMNATGLLRGEPQSWRDYFFPEIHGVDGS